MEVRQEQIDDTTIALEIVIDAGTVRTAIEHAYRRETQRVHLPGFRKGKVPPGLLKRVLDHEAIQRDAVHTLIGPALAEATRHAGVHPIAPPELEEVQLGDDQALRLRARFAVQPPVELGDYTGLRVTRRRVHVAEADVERELERLRAARSRYEPVETLETGDLAVVDVEVLDDGGIVPEASEKAYPLQVGSETLLPPLNDALVGAAVAEPRTVAVTFPADHRVPRLAGKSAEIRFIVREAKRRILPVVDDSFARAVSDCHSVEQLRARIHRNLQHLNDQLADSDVQADLLRHVVRQSRVPLPRLLVEREVEQAQTDLLADLARRGERLEDYLARRGLAREQWATQLRLDAEARIERALVLRAVGAREGIEVTDAELDAEIARLAERERLSARQMQRRLEHRNQLSSVRSRLYNAKVLQRLTDLADIAEEDITHAGTTEHP